MIKLNSNMHAFVAGRTQEGKSTLVKSFVNKYPKICIHDRKWEWSSFAQRNHYYIIHTPEHLKKLLQRGAKRILYQPADPSVDDFDAACKVVYDTTNLTYVVDECASYAQTGKVPYYLGEIMRLGSGRGVGCVNISQRPRDVSNVLLSESSVIISFRLLLKTDRVKLAEICGQEVDPKLPSDPIEAAKIPSLATMPKFCFMCFDSMSGKVTWHNPIPVRQLQKSTPL